MQPSWVTSLPPGPTACHGFRKDPKAAVPRGEQRAGRAFTLRPRAAQYPQPPQPPWPGPLLRRDTVLARWGRAPKPGSSPMSLLGPGRTSMGEELWEPWTLAGSISRGILPVPPCKKKRSARRASMPLPAEGSQPFCSHNTRGRERDCVLEPSSQLCQQAS